MTIASFAEKLLDVMIIIYGIGWLLCTVIVLGIIIYITKIYLDGTDYSDGVKAGIYIAIAIPGFFIAFFIGKYLPLFLVFAMDNS